MTLFVIVAHAPLASALAAVATHVYAECAGDMVALDVPPQQGVDEVERRLRAAVGGRPALVLVDTFGATPCNAAQRVAQDANVRVVAGVNVPMLWRTLCYRDDSLDEITRKALEGAVRGVMPVPGSVPPQNQSSPPGRNAQVDHHDQ
jgi:PTS system ascorbate-specific IIA component